MATSRLTTTPQSKVNASKLIPTPNTKIGVAGNMAARAMLLTLHTRRKAH